MKKINTLLLVLILIVFSGAATAQMKVGKNPTTLAPGVMLQVEGNSSSQFVVDTFGKLGVGTTTPSQRLHVKGQVQIDTLSSGSYTDSIVTVDQNGVLKKRTLSSIVPSTALNVTTDQTGNYTALVTDDIILYNCNTAGITLTLPTSGIPIGKRYYVSNKGSNLVDLSPAVRETVNVNLPAGQSIMLMYVGGTGAGSWSIMTGY